MQGKISVRDMRGEIDAWLNKNGVVFLIDSAVKLLLLMGLTMAGGMMITVVLSYHIQAGNISNSVAGYFFGATTLSCLVIYIFRLRITGYEPDARSSGIAQSIAEVFAEAAAFPLVMGLAMLFTFGLYDTVRFVNVPDIDVYWFFLGSINMVLVYLFMPTGTGIGLRLLDYKSEVWKDRFVRFIAWVDTYRRPRGTSPPA